MKVERFAGLDSDIARALGISGRVLLANERHRKPAPAFLFGPAQEEFREGYRRHGVSWAVSLFTARDITLCGPTAPIGPFLVKDGVSFSHRPLYLDGASAPAQAYLAERQAALENGRAALRPIAGQVVLLATIGYEIYGHWLVDFLPKLYVLEQAGLDIGRLTFLCPDDSAVGRNLLRFVGIRDEQVVLHNPVTEVLQIEELLIPTLTRRHADYSPWFAPALDYLNERLDRANPGIRPGADRRVFVSRTRSGKTSRQLLNTQEIEDIAARHGFRPVYPEQIPLVEQVALFRGAREIMGQYGSALHTSMFARSELKMACLQGSGTATAHTLQSAIGTARGQATGYVIGRQQPVAPPNVGFRIEPKDLLTCIHREFS